MNLPSLSSDPKTSSVETCKNLKLSFFLFKKYFVEHSKRLYVPKILVFINPEGSSIDLST